MTPDQSERLFGTLGRIEEKIDSHLRDDEAVHNRQDAAISTLYTKTNTNDKSIARIRGWGSGIATLGTVVISLLGLDRFGG